MIEGRRRVRHYLRPTANLLIEVVLDSLFVPSVLDDDERDDFDNDTILAPLLGDETPSNDS